MKLLTIKYLNASITNSLIKKIFFFFKKHYNILIFISNSFVNNSNYNTDKM